MKLRHKIVVTAAAGAAGAGLGLSQSPAPAPTAHRGRETSANPPAPTSPVDAASPPASTGPTTTTTAYVVTVPTDPPTTTTIRPRPIPPTTNPEHVDDDLSDIEWWKNQPGYRAELLACIRQWEQNDNPRKGPTGYSSDTGNGFYGAYQFDLPTWRSVGGTGNPAHAEPAEQDARAWALYQRRGLQPWPTPDARCAR